MTILWQQLHLTHCAGSVGNFSQDSCFHHLPGQCLQIWSICYSVCWRGAQAPKPAPPARTGSSDIESLLQSLLLGTLPRRQRTQLGPMRRDWATVVCLSYDKVGHGATPVSGLERGIPVYMLPGWKVEKVGGGYIMISPHVAAERRRAGNDDLCHLHHVTTA